MASKSRCFYSAAVISWQEKMTILHPSAWKQKQVFYTKPQCFTHAGWVVIVPKLKLEDKHSAEPKKDIENSILTNFKLQLEETFRCDFAEMYVGNIHSGNEHQERSRLYNHLIRHTDMKYRIVSGRSIQKMPTHCPPLMWQKELRVFLVSHRETPQIFFCIVKKKTSLEKNTLRSPLLTRCCIFYFLIEWIMSTLWTNQGIDINFRSIWPQYSRMPKLCDLSSRCRRIDPWQSNCPKGSTVNTKNRDWSISAAPRRCVWPWPQRRNRSELEPQRRRRVRLTSRESSRCLLETNRLNEESLHHLLLWKTVTQSAERRLHSSVLWTVW